MNAINNKTYQNECDQNSNLSGNNYFAEFPIKFNENSEFKKGLAGLKDKIYERLPDVCREIHGSLFNKDDIIKSIREKYPFISKSSLNQFLKEFCERVLIKKFNRKMFYLKENIVREANISEEEAKKILEENKKAFEISYEEKKLKEEQLKVINFFNFYIFFN